MNCNQYLQVRRFVVINNRIGCNHCLWRRRLKNAMAVGATITSAARCSHKHANLVLACGHAATRQYIRIERAAQGGHALGCKLCREARYAAEADGSGWKLTGPAADGKTGYRSYRHDCGHDQDHAIINMCNHQIDCAGCGERWSSKPSSIYLFKIVLRQMTVLKAGFSSNPARRLHQQLGDAARMTGQILRTIDIKTGSAALKYEQKAHRTLRRHHPEMVVAQSDFAEQIHTKSEIYTLAAEDYIHALFDDIERQHAREDGSMT